MTKIISRAQAKAVGLKHYFTGKPCKHGHVAMRLVSAETCMICLAENTRRYAEANPDTIRDNYQRWYAENLDGQRARSRNYQRQMDPHQKLASAREWRANNAEAAQSAKRRYKQANPHKNSAYEALRRASKLMQTPPWVTDNKEAKNAINAVYFEAMQLAEQTGVPHEVDHIVPLQGPRRQSLEGNKIPWRDFVGPWFRAVYGLHVPCNLRAITSANNRSKNNRIAGTA